MIGVGSEDWPLAMRIIGVGSEDWPLAMRIGRGNGGWHRLLTSKLESHSLVSSDVADSRCEKSRNLRESKRPNVQMPKVETRPTQGMGEALERDGRALPAMADHGPPDWPRQLLARV